MASTTIPAHPAMLPLIPSKHNEFISYVSAHPDTPMPQLLEPYKQFDAKLREIFAQEPHHSALSDHHINTVPVFDGHEADIKIRRRHLEAETDEEKSKYVMPLKDDDRKPNDSPAIVESFKQFQNNFNVFSESSLVDMDWSNVVVAGSAVVTAMLPIPEKYSSSKRGIRQYYHEIVAPASDVDLFLYDLTEEQALEKIKQIETKIRDAILAETTVVRTKNAITIASQYPIRHVQIVLRVYKSISEILTGFDVDCSCAAYDGNQVYASPRALAAYMTQVNTIDLTRRSPSYENRLSKYSHRDFEVYWPQLDRSRIDPTIFERSFGRTVGLARLLVLEKLPKSEDRDAYLDQRRQERGRPPVNRYHRGYTQLRGNIKDQYEDEVAEWVEEDEVSSYHTFTIPYGEKFHARKIEKLLYTKDLLLNAEWNMPKDREVNLHRHPCFFGRVEDVIQDCCGHCPKPSTPEEEDVAEEEQKIYVSGTIGFIKDDPGRQAIGSFNPITDDDWTEMAYVGNTARLCQAIVDGDLEHVEDWLAQEGSDPNRRDYTGRTPLHLAVMVSTTEIVECFVDHGARLVARLADGRTALHLAATRGDVEMVRILMERSEENEEEELLKEDRRRETRVAAKRYTGKPTAESESDDNTDYEDHKDGEDAELVDDEDDEDDTGNSETTGGFVKVEPEEHDVSDNLPNDDEDEPDVYDVNVLAWDVSSSPLHFAIVNGHVAVVKQLVQEFGADVLLPIKLLDGYNRSPRGAILTLVLALTLPMEKAEEMALTLLQLGASSAQADLSQFTALQYYVAHGAEALQTLLEQDKIGVMRAINHLAVGSFYWNASASSPLITAIQSNDALAALKLLETGASPSIEFGDWMKSFQKKFLDQVSRNNPEQNKLTFYRQVEQPIVIALQCEEPSVILELLDRGVDPNTLTTKGQICLHDEYQRTYLKGESLLDAVRNAIKDLRGYKGEGNEPEAPTPLKDDNYYLKDVREGTYKFWVASTGLKSAKNDYQSHLKQYRDDMENWKNQKGLSKKKETVQNLIANLEGVEAELLKRGAKPFCELYRDIKEPDEDRRYKYEPWKPKPFEVEFTFNLPDLTGVRREAYLVLYQAAWKGDLETVKSLTLALWGPDKDQVPLKLAVTDTTNSSPFAIAVMRGHLDLARAILKIAQAQYEPREPQRERFKMRSSDSDEDSEIDDDIHIYGEIIDDRFTIDDIGEVSTHVKSDVTPLKLLGWDCPVSRFLEGEVEGVTSSSVKDVGTDPGLYSNAGVSKAGVQSRGGSPPRRRLGSRLTPAQPDPEHITARNLLQYAIWADDLELLTFLLDLGAEYTAQQVEDDPSSTRIFRTSEDDFQYAIKLGRTRMLAEMLKKTGAGVPLEDLVKQSGVKIKEKPRYYQGLSVHGRKRADWAAAGRGMQHVQAAGNKHPPLLEAAFKGSLESVEWFLSEAPMRLYSEFAAVHPHDKRLKGLSHAAGGFDKAISAWLGTRSDLVIHCAVLSEPGPDSVRLLEYLIKAAPNSLNAKFSEGHTPLQLAFSLHRIALARVLVAAGADQTCRDRLGSNLLHSLCRPIDASTAVLNQSEHLRALLALIDARLLPPLFTERSAYGPGAATPLACWLAGVGHNITDAHVEVFKTLLEASGGAELEMVNGEGDTPLHVAVKQQLSSLVSVVLDARPELLHRENATGRTPLEMAHDAVLAERFADTPRIEGGRREAALARPAWKFVVEVRQESGKEVTYKVCVEAAGTEHGRRRLVSLGEANEVARRLTERETKRVKVRYNRRGREDDDEEEEVERGDEIDAWYGIASKWDEYNKEKGAGGEKNV